jgi:predicted transcriptional regulator of viral defense system
MRSNDKNFNREIQAFKEHGGILRAVDAIKLGIQPRNLYAMKERGDIETLSRGLYRLSNLPPLSHPDLVISSLKIPQGVICLTSALAFYEMTVEIPHKVDIALRAGTERPRLNYPPMHYLKLHIAAESKSTK